MDRIDSIMHLLKRDGRGLEFGPSYNPIAPKRAGFRVETVDHLDQQGLIEKYRGHDGVNLDNIEPVDHVWTGQKLTELITGHGQYDWIIASHVIEHVPNFVGFINECATLLKPDGILSLVIPDLRYTFDCMRWPTTTGDLIQAHIEQRDRHSPGKVFDYFATAVRRDGNIVWREAGSGDYSLVLTFEQAQQLMREAIETDNYIDLHTWVFSSSSFRLVVADLRRLDLLHLGEACFFDSTVGEFYVSLSRNAVSSEFDRIEVLRRIHRELREIDEKQKAT